jgi:hypothetical protein
MPQLPSSQPGFWKIYRGPANSGWYFACNCPCGCQYPDIVPIEKAGEHTRGPNQVFWEWDGNLQAPTLSPSFKRHTPCAIHFNLTKGIYIAHADGAPLSPHIWKPA